MLILCICLLELSLEGKCIYWVLSQLVANKKRFQRSMLIIFFCNAGLYTLHGCDKLTPYLWQSCVANLSADLQNGTQSSN